MSQRGEQLITSSDPAPAPWWRRYQTPAIILLVALVLAVNYFLPNDGNAPQRPVSPKPHVATFTAADSGTGTPMAVHIAGGAYTVSYETVSLSDSRLTGLDRSKVYVADFTKGTQSGNLDAADTIILIGRLNLGIDSIAGQDHFSADVLNQGKNIKAHFNYADSARGPPDAANGPVVKKILVVGELKQVSLPETFGHSQSDTWLLDLDPTRQEMSDYEAATREYEDHVKQHEQEQQQHEQHPIE